MQTKKGKELAFAGRGLWVANISSRSAISWSSACGVLRRSVVSLCNPLDCSLLGSSVHEIFQARLLKWVAISSSRESSWPRGRIRVFCISCIAGRFFTAWGKAQWRVLCILKSQNEFRACCLPLLATQGSHLTPLCCCSSPLWGGCPVGLLEIPPQLQFWAPDASVPTVSSALLRAVDPQPRLLTHPGPLCFTFWELFPNLWWHTRGIELRKDTDKPWSQLCENWNAGPSAYPLCDFCQVT